VVLSVREDMLEIDAEFPCGRIDYRINVRRPGGSIKVKVL